MKKKINSLSVVLPAYNEEDIIAQTIKEVYAHISKLTDSFEVIVVNDGSSDATADKVKTMQREFPNLVLIEHDVNRGYGEALRSGFNAASYEWIFQMDSDGQFRIEEIDKFLHEITNYDMVAGYRKNRADPWHRSVLTWGYMSMLNVLFDLPTSDIGCAFKLFKRDTWLQIQPIESHDHKIFLVEWMSKLKKADVKIMELPVSHYVRSGGKPTGAKIDVVQAMFVQLLDLKMKKIRMSFFYRRIQQFVVSEYGSVILVIVGVKLAIFILSMMAFAMFESVPDKQPLVEYLSNIWNRWDTLYWYVNIAEHGYKTEGFQANTIAFLPLYPLLIRLGSAVVGNLLWSALLISNILSVVGLFVFYLLAKLEFNKVIAWRALLALMLFPSAYFFNAAYTEGPFLLFVVGSFYFARRKSWKWAGVFGGLASLTRIMGVIVWPALLIEFLLQRRESKQPWFQAIWTLIVPGGFVIYLLLNQKLFGSPFAFMDQLDGFWNKHFAWPWVAFASKWQAIDNFPFSGGNIVTVIAELLAGLIFVVGTIWSAVRLRFSYTVYLMCLSFMVLSTNVLQSTPRYLLAAFPLFFIMGILGKYKIVRVVWLPFSIGVLVLFMTYFVLGWEGTF